MHINFGKPTRLEFDGYINSERINRFSLSWANIKEINMSADPISKQLCIHYDFVDSESVECEILFYFDFSRNAILFTLYKTLPYFSQFYQANDEHVFSEHHFSSRMNGKPIVQLINEQLLQRYEQSPIKGLDGFIESNRHMLADDNLRKLYLQTAGI